MYFCLNHVHDMYKKNNGIVSYSFFPALKKATIEDYVKLFYESFKGDTKLTREYLQWQYIDNPHGKVIGVDAFLEDELVAHYAIIPRHYQLLDTLYKSALSVNTATLPKHQGKKLFTSLAEKTYTIAKEEGIQFIVGVANGSSVRGFIKRLGFSLLGQIRMNLSCKGAQKNKNQLNLSVDNDWLIWRLNNPSRTFTKVKHTDGSTTIRTVVNSIPFNIYRNNVNSSSIINISKGCKILPAFTPNFCFMGINKLQLPIQMQPSPWHLIWLTLDISLDPNLQEKLQFDGLAMDTF